MVFARFSENTGAVSLEAAAQCLDNSLADKSSGGSGELVGRWQAGGRQAEQDRIRQSTNEYSQVRTNTVKYDQIQTSTVTRTRPDRFQACQGAPDPLGRVPDPKSTEKRSKKKFSESLRLAGKSLVKSARPVSGPPAAPSVHIRQKHFFQAQMQYLIISLYIPYRSL